ncbi:MAG: hypothetical protein IH587_08105 [Anaerolineae bacterium]|nr:hypothetical protein [Anaerolineae bacterium]
MSLFISVFVVACNVVSNISATIVPTEMLRVTLTLRQPRGPTETPARPQERTTSTPAPVNPGSDNAPTLLQLDPPRCYAETPQTTVCLGLVHNPLDYALQRVSLRVAVVTDSSDLRAERIVTIEQAIIPPNAIAPYRSSFPIRWTADLMPTVSLVSAELTFDRSVYVALVTEDEQSEQTEERYVISGTIFNPGPYTAVDIRALVVLREKDGSVSGYRVATLSDRLPAGERMPLRIDIIPYSRSSELDYYLYLEARREDIHDKD